MILELLSRCIVHNLLYFLMMKISSNLYFTEDLELSLSVGLEQNDDLA